MWLPVAIDAPSEEVEIQPCRGLPLTGADASGSKLSLLEDLAAETGAEALPAVQCDAMNITIQKYDATEKDGTADGRKCHTERNHLHNAVIGFVIPEGPRELGGKINLEHKRYLSEYLTPGNLPHTAPAVLETGGLKPGDPILFIRRRIPQNLGSLQSDL